MGVAAKGMALNEHSRDSNSPVLAGNLKFSNQISGLPFSHHDFKFFPTLATFSNCTVFPCILSLYDQYCVHLVFSNWLIHMMLAEYVPIVHLKSTAY